jgi:polyadenylate-binding protein
MDDLKDTLTIERRPLEIQSFTPREERVPSKAVTRENTTNVYITNLPPQIGNDQALGKIFERFGRVKSPRLMLDGQRRSKGYGFCSMDDHEMAVAAVEGLNGHHVYGSIVEARLHYPGCQYA